MTTYSPLPLCTMKTFLSRTDVSVDGMSEDRSLGNGGERTNFDRSLAVAEFFQVYLGGFLAKTITDGVGQGGMRGAGEDATAPHDGGE